MSHRRSLYLATGDLTAADCTGPLPGHPGRLTALERRHRTAKRSTGPSSSGSTPSSCSPHWRTTPSASSPRLSASPVPERRSQVIRPTAARPSTWPCRSIADGRTDLAVVVACGSWLDLVPRMEMADIGLLSKCRRGARSFRPLDRRRDGFIAGEGAAALVLEPTSAAHGRGAACARHDRGRGRLPRGCTGLRAERPPHPALHGEGLAGRGNRARRPRLRQPARQRNAKGRPGRAAIGRRLVPRSRGARAPVRPQAVHRPHGGCQRCAGVDRLHRGRTPRHGSGNSELRRG